MQKTERKSLRITKSVGAAYVLGSVLDWEVRWSHGLDSRRL